MSTATTDYSVPTIAEPFYRYGLHWDPAAVRTDTPDLIAVFSRDEDETALLAEGYREMAPLDLELAEQDMAAGFETLETE